jgi:hypothetical protein
MPHTFVADIKSKLPEYAIIVLGKARAFLISRVFELVNKILEELRETCPPPNVLNSLLKSINTIESAVQTVQKTINKISKLPPLLDGAILACKVYLDFQYHLNPKFAPIPINPPPGAFQGTVLEQKTNNRLKRIRTIENILEDLETAKATITFAVAATNGTLGPILGIIQVIKSLLEACFDKQDLTDEERKAIIDDIQGKTNDLLTKGIPYENAAGDKYTIKVINDPNSPAVAQKRQAIAQDYRGITILTGPSSFASDPNILIDEIKFRLDQLNQPPIEPAPRPRPKTARQLNNEQSNLSSPIETPSIQVAAAPSPQTTSPVTTGTSIPKPTPTPRVKTQRRKRRTSEVIQEARRLESLGFTGTEVIDRLRDFGANNFQIMRAL